MVYYALRAIDRALFLQIKSNQAKKEIYCSKPNRWTKTKKFITWNKSTFVVVGTCSILMELSVRYVRQLSASGCFCPSDKLLLIINVINQSFCCNNLLHKLWKCLTLEFSSLCSVINHTAIEINFNLVASLNTL